MLFPKPNKTLWQLLGPSVLLVAMAISGGELLLWPDLTAEYDFGVIWAVPIILFLQYFVNMEIERYTTVTGKNTLTGLLGLQKWLGLLFIISIVVSLAWPAWASPAGSMVGYLLGAEQYSQWFGIAIMLGLIAIWQSKKSYFILERISKLGLVAVLAIVLFTIGSNFDTQLLTSFGEGVRSFGTFPDGINRFALLSALAYGGVVGVLNLVQSDWVQSKGYGAAGVENPEKIIWNPISVGHFKEWWRLLKIEHGIVYYFGNILGIGLLTSLAFLTIRGRGVSGFGVLTEQVDVLSDESRVLGLVFGIAVVLLFTMAQMTILDAQGKLLQKCLPQFGSSAKISQFMGFVGIAILLLSFFVPSFSQPAFLLRLSASLSAGVMVIYPPLLLILNSKLPFETRPNWFSKLMVITCSVFYLIIICWSLL